MTPVLSAEALFLQVLPGNVPNQDPVGYQDALGCNGGYPIRLIRQGRAKFQLCSGNIVNDVAVANRILGHPDRITIHVKRSSRNHHGTIGKDARNRRGKYGTESSVRMSARDIGTVRELGVNPTANPAPLFPEGDFAPAPKMHVFPVQEVVGAVDGIHQGFPLSVSRDSGGYCILCLSRCGSA